MNKADAARLLTDLRLLLDELTGGWYQGHRAKSLRDAIKYIEQEEMRRHLRNKDWRRHDLGGREYWAHSTLLRHHSSEMLGVSLATAYKRQKQQDGAAKES